MLLAARIWTRLRRMPLRLDAGGLDARKVIDTCCWRVGTFRLHELPIFDAEATFAMNEFVRLRHQVGYLVASELRGPARLPSVSAVWQNWEGDTKITRGEACSKKSGFHAIATCPFSETGSKSGTPWSRTCLPTSMALATSQ